MSGFEWPEKLGEMPGDLKNLLWWAGEMETAELNTDLLLADATAAVAALIERLCFLLDVADLKTELAEVREQEIASLKERKDRWRWVAEHESKLRHTEERGLYWPIEERGPNEVRILLAAYEKESDHD